MMNLGFPDIRTTHSNKLYSHEPLITVITYVTELTIYETFQYHLIYNLFLIKSLDFLSL